MGGVEPPAPPPPARLRQLQAVGVLSGVAAGAWLGAAEAPTKVVTLGISPVAVSLVMVLADRGRKGVAGRRVGEGDQHGGGADLVATAGVAA